MLSQLTHRGPDGTGQAFIEPVDLHLGHARLAILDIACGAQPMRSVCGRASVVFNGEIYNHAELRAELEAKGFAFATDHSDTETLLNAYLAWGEDCVSRFNGMWAFALFDHARKRLFCSRDRFGKKPFYYHARPGFFAFASELTSLLAHAEVPRQVDELSLKKLFGYGFIPGSRSILRQVKKLEPGTNLTVDLTDFSVKTTPYYRFCLEPDLSWLSRSEDDLAEELTALLADATRLRLLADVPVGVLLSGGIDSSTVAALASRFTTDLQTFSIGFREATFDESAYSQLVSQKLGSTHHHKVFDSEAAREAAPWVADRLDEPMADPSILPTSLVCSMAREKVTVVLGGDGADELFAGYDPFQALAYARIYETLTPRPVHAALRLLSTRLPVSHVNMALGFKVFRFLRGMSHRGGARNPAWLGPLDEREIADLFQSPVSAEELYSEAIEVYESCPSKSAVDKTLEFYTRLYLADDILTKVDRASMWHSLEARAPFLDVRVAEFARRLPSKLKFKGRTTKYLLKKAARKLIPAEVVDRPKKGFGIPLGEWLATGRLPVPLDKDLPGPRLDRLGAALSAHRQNRFDHRMLLWTAWLWRSWHSFHLG